MKLDNIFKSKPLLLILGTSISIISCADKIPEQRQTALAEIETLNTDNQKPMKPNIMAFARYVPERQDDFAWENDKVAFRVYGPAAPLKGHSSGVDAWLKKVDYSIIDKWYKNHLAGISYHEDKGEGYDPYHTGISRGVGGSAIWIEGRPYAAHSYTSYDVIESGSDKLTFTLTYEWQTPLGLVNELKTVSLPLGTQLYQVESLFTLNGKPAVLPIGIGLATHDEKATVSYNKVTGRISTWEYIDELGLGTGALLATQSVYDIKHVQSDIKDESHIWILTSTTNKGELSYKAGFAWEAAGDINTDIEWQSYLDAQEK